MPTTVIGGVGHPWLHSMHTDQQGGGVRGGVGGGMGRRGGGRGTRCVDQLCQPEGRCGQNMTTFGETYSEGCHTPCGVESRPP